MFVSKLQLEQESWVSFAKDGVTVSWNNFTSFKSVSNVSFDVLLGPFFAELLLEVKDEVEAFLVCKAVERASESIHTSREGKVGIGKRRSDQMSCVRRNVATFVITTLNKVKSLSYGLDSVGK